MKGKRLLLALMSVTLSGGVAASEIYKWIDENGNVHYEDRPSGASSEQRLAMTYSRTNNGVVQERIEARLEREAEREEARAAAAKEEEEAAAEQEEAEAMQQKCVEWRNKLQTMIDAQRVYRVGEDGERNYLDNTQRQEARQKAEQMIAENCN